MYDSLVSSSVTWVGQFLQIRSTLKVACQSVRLCGPAQK